MKITGFLIASIILVCLSMPLHSQTNRGAAISHAYFNRNHYPNTSYNLNIKGITTDMNGDGIAWGSLELTLDTDPEKEWISLREHFFTPSFLNVLGYDVTLSTYDLEVGNQYQFDFKVCTGSTEGGGAVIVVCAQWNNFQSTIIPFPVNLLDVSASGGSERYIDILWDVPVNEGCDIQHFCLLSSDEPILSTNYKKAERILIDIPSAESQISFTSPFAKPGLYYAIGGYEADGRLIALSTSIQAVYTLNDFSLIGPTDDSIVDSLPLDFQWRENPGCYYELYIDADTSFSDPIVINNIPDTIYSYSGALDDHNYYYWKIKAIDSVTGASYWSDETLWRFALNTVNMAPEAFGATYPVQYDICDNLRPSFSWEHSADSGDIVHYELLIGIGSQMDSVILIDSIRNSFYHLPFDLPEEETLFWSVTAYDTDLDSTTISDGLIQFICSVNDVPTGFSKAYPHRNLNVLNSGVFLMEEVTGPLTFQWKPSSDPDGGLVTYMLMVDDNYLFTDPEIYSGISDTSFLYPGTLIENGEYFWNVYAIDQDGDTTRSNGGDWSFVVNEYDELPLAFELVTPQDTIGDPNLEFEWVKPIDPDPNAVVGYDLWYGLDSTFQYKIAKNNLRYDRTTLSVPYQPRKWVKSALNAYSGRSWYCGDTVSNLYNNSWLQALVSGEIDLTGLSGSLLLRFKHQYDTEGPNYDGGVVQIIDSQNNAIVIQPLGSYSTDSLWGFTYHGLNSMPAFSGNSGGWVDEEFDISDFLGEKIQIRFLFASDEYLVDEQGWYLDNILVQNNADTLFFDDCDGQEDFLFEPLSMLPIRNEKYYWLVRAIDKNTSSTPGVTYSADTGQFVISPFQRVSGYALLDSTENHSGILVKAISKSPLACSDSVFSDSSGYYELGLKPGYYNVNYTKEGYETPPDIESVPVDDEDFTLPNVHLNLHYSPPSSLVAINGNEIELIWRPPGDVSNFSKYRIYRSVAENNNYMLLDSLINITDTNYFDEDVGSGQTYFYKVSAVYYDLFESDHTIEDSAYHWYTGPITYVSTTGTDTLGHGTLASPLATIGTAIRTVAEQDTIILLPGNYYEQVDFRGKNVILSSQYMTTGDTSYIYSTILNGFSGDPTVTFTHYEDTTSLISGLSILNGSTAIYCYYGSPTLEDLIISNNTSGLTLSRGHINMRNSILINNLSRNIYIARSAPEFTNVIIAGNENNTAAGVYCYNYAEPFFNNVLFYGNTYAIKCRTYNGGLISGYLTLRNCIVWDNPIEEFQGSITYSDVQGGWAGLGNINADPLFMDAANNDFHLSYGSPCIDSGDSTIFPADPGVDKDGKLRPLGRWMDMGPFEYGEYWQGNASDQWNEPSNWSMEQVPDSSYSITIPASSATMPVINTGAECKELFLQEDSEVIIQNGGSLQVGDN